MEKMHCAVVDIANERLDVAAAIEFVSDPGFGGIAMFVGRVRDMNHGRRVAGVSYDLFDVLAVNIFNDIASDTLREFDGKLKNRKGKKKAETEKKRALLIVYTKITKSIHKFLKYIQKYEGIDKLIKVHLVLLNYRKISRI